MANKIAYMSKLLEKSSSKVGLEPLLFRIIDLNFYETYK
jgi:hypothetical protein